MRSCYLNVTSVHYRQVYIPAYELEFSDNRYLSRSCWSLSGGLNCQFPSVGIGCPKLGFCHDPCVNRGSWRGLRRKVHRVASW